MDSWCKKSSSWNNSGHYLLTISISLRPSAHSSNDKHQSFKGKWMSVHFYFLSLRSKSRNSDWKKASFKRFKTPHLRIKRLINCQVKRCVNVCVYMSTRVCGFARMLRQAGCIFKLTRLSQFNEYSYFSFSFFLD